MMRKTIVMGSTVLLAVLSLASAGWAADARGREGNRRGGAGHDGFSRLMGMLDNDRAKAYLNLTDPQVDQLRQIAVEAEKSTVKNRAEMRVQGIELRELLRVDKPDREAVMKKVQEISDLRGQMMKQHIGALLAAKSVLTPEQQKKINSFAGRREGFGMGRERFGERAGEWGPRHEAPSKPEGPPEPSRHAGEPPVQ